MLSRFLIFSFFICNSAFTQNLVASFTKDSNPTNINPCVNFTNTSSGNPIMFEWDITGPTSSATFNSTDCYWCFPDTGCYTVRLIATDVMGNSDTTSQTICVQSDFIFFFVNAFTPNGDGVNDIYNFLGVGIDRVGFKMGIYDRWGGTVFYTTDMNEGWNGAVQGSGRIAPIGPYLVVFEFYDEQHVKHEYRNSILLIR